MSSIYKKGRDGYFYYQAYILNKKTGKKDRRVFHSLGTKVLKEAEEKKNFYDHFYSKKDRNTKLNLPTFLRYAIALIMLVVFILTLNLRVNKKREILIDKTIISKQKIDSIKNINNDYTSNHSTIKTIEISEKLNHSTDSFLKNNENVQTQDEISLNVNLEYKIIRKDAIKNAFNQCKITVTAEKKYNVMQLLKICHEIKKNNNKFLNFIICIYSNDEIGYQIAKGSDFRIYKDLDTKVWLAMYSFNEVEGEYFDINPGGYFEYN